MACWGMGEGSGDLEGRQVDGLGIPADGVAHIEGVLPIARAQVGVLIVPDVDLVGGQTGRRVDPLHGVVHGVDGDDQPITRHQLVRRLAGGDRAQNLRRPHRDVQNVDLRVRWYRPTRAWWRR